MELFTHIQREVYITERKWTKEPRGRESEVKFYKKIHETKEKITMNL